MSFTSSNPATGKVLQSYRAHTRKQIDAIITQVHGAQSAWKELALDARAAHLRALARELRKELPELAATMTAEMGKPITEARREIEKCAMVCEFYADHAAAFLRPERPAGAPDHTRIVYEPLGVILSIMPWNYPYWQVFRAAAPALAAGNTIIIKHSANVTGCALAIEALFQRAGLPNGVLRIVLTTPKGVPPIIADPRVRMVTLTGSTAAGKKVAALAGASLKPCVFELGGTDSYLVLADADLAHAAKTLAAGRLINGGQSCVSVKRMIVVESVRAKFEKLLVAEFKKVKRGDPAKESTTLGPLARADLRDNLHQLVVGAVKAGARLLLGGKIPAGRGHYYPATILTNVRRGSPAYNEELFGPVAVILPVADEAEAIAVANDTPYGLGAGVFTTNLKRGEEIAHHYLDAGMTCVNDFVRSAPQLPFGGTKESGYGRELGREGILALVNTKTVSVK